MTKRIGVRARIHLDYEAVALVVSLEGDSAPPDVVSGVAVDF